MKRTVIDCDFCGKEGLQDYHTLEFIIGTQVDPPSGRTEEVTESLEFCTVCLGNLAQDAINSRTRDDQKALYARWADQKKKSRAGRASVRHPARHPPAGIVYREG